MGIKERLTAEPAQYPRSLCRVCKIMSELPADDREFLNENFAKAGDDKTRYSDSKVADILTEEGFPVGLQSVSRHRRGQCGSR